MNRIRRIVLLFAGASLAGMLTPLALATEAPVGAAVLTIAGKISKTNADEQFVFDREMLEKLPQHSFRTRTPWYTEEREFTGPLLRDVLAAVGAEGEVMHALALNDYKMAIPVSDAHDYDVIVAHLMDGKPMPVRDKGPLFIIYPFDDKRELRSLTYYSRSVWQLKTLEIQ